MKLFLSAVILAVIVSIAAGLFLSGPPSQERRRQFDERRSEDLASIAGAVDEYWAQKGRLPRHLAELTGASSLVIPRSVNDPHTGALYDYRPTDSLTYELCAVFETDATAEAAGLAAKYPGGVPPRTRFEHHGTGRTCFSLQPRRVVAPH